MSAVSPRNTQPASQYISFSLIMNDCCTMARAMAP